MQTTDPKTLATLAREAREYLIVLQQEGLLKVSLDQRIREVEAEISSRGTYTQTIEELYFGARLAWRNSVRCVGRKYWEGLSIRDCRHLTTAEDMAVAVAAHLRWSTNKGKIRPLITVFPPAAPESPGIRIWNEQLIRYAGYRQPDGTVLGDPRQLELTELLLRQGWEPPERTAFDVLPLALQLPNEAPRFFQIPRDAILEVEITHPDYPWFAELGLKWHALPAIASMVLEIGGLHYTAAPFSGWYMLTEIGARNFADEGRYNYLPIIAQRLGLDMTSHRNLWRDRALVELNVAVIHAFREAGVKMVDHHTATQHFVEFESLEAKKGRPTYADWSWIVPPVSGSTTPVYHRLYEKVELKPNFYPQPAPWHNPSSLLELCPHHSNRSEPDGMLASPAQPGAIGCPAI
jgi:nitric-oxide synthase, bacterial